MLADPAVFVASSILISIPPEGGYGTKMSPRNHNISLDESQHHVVNPTNTGGALDDGVEDRLHIRGRAADDAKHLGRCRLMLQRLPQFCVALLNLFEQPHVLNSDDGLIGESFEQRDLFIRERSNFTSPQAHHANRRTLPQQRHGQYRAKRHLTGPDLVLRIAPDVMDVGDPSIKDRAAYGDIPVGGRGNLLRDSWTSDSVMPW